MNLTNGDNPLEATTLDHVFIPRNCCVDLEKRLMSSLIQAELTNWKACSRPGRPYWLRDCPSGFGGFTKVYEYGTRDKVKRMHSVAYVIKPRTENESAYLCFSLMSKALTEKPWFRDPDSNDPSRSVVLDSIPLVC